MRALRIQALNFKGKTFDYELSPLQLIVGSNFSGKTAVIEAVRLALMGHIPEIGKLSRATWELSSAQSMNVCLVFDDTRAASRGFTLEGNSIKCLASPTAEEFEKLDLPLLNSEHYFSLTDKQRTEYVFTKVRLPDYTIDNIVARLQRISFDEDHSEATEFGKQKFIEVARAALRTNSGQIGEGLADAKEVCGKEFSYYNKRAKETQGAVSILTELKNRETEASAQRLKDLDAQITATQGKMKGITQEVGAAGEKVIAWDRATERAAKITDILKQKPVDYTGKIEKETTLLESLRATIAVAPKLDHITAARKNVQDLREHVSSGKDTRDKLQAEIHKAEKSLGELAGLKECPFCRSHDASWKYSLETHYRAVIAESSEVHAGIVTGLKASEKTVKECSELLALLEKNYQEAQKAQIDAKALEGSIAAYKNLHNGEASKRTEFEKELKSLQAIGEKPDTAAQLQELRALEESLSQLSTKKTAAIKLQQDLKRAAESALEHEKAKAFVTVIKAIGKELTTIQAEMIDKVFGGLLAVANSIVGNIFRSPLAFHEGEVGRWDGAKFITHRTFSGTEKALTFVAIAVALSSQAPLRLLILDEIGRLDEANQLRILANLAEAVQNKVLDQVIVAGTKAPPAIPADWGVLRLKEEK